MDDPLVTMEFDVSFEIFENLIINALSEKTIILVTDEPEVRVTFIGFKNIFLFTTFFIYSSWIDATTRI